jgi:DnaJ-domain-containing protein 1
MTLLNWVLNILILLCFYAVGRTMSFFSRGLMGRAIVLVAIVIITHYFFSRTLALHWSVIAAMALLTLGAFWRDIRTVIGFLSPFSGLRKRRASMKNKRDIDSKLKQARARHNNEHTKASDYAKQSNDHASSDYTSQTQAHASSDLDPDILADAYEILGVPPTSSDERCKQAYRSLSSVYHPDKVASMAANRKQQFEEEMKKINAAWKTISSKKY